MCRLLLNCQVKARPNSCGRGPLGIAYHDSVLEDPLLINQRTELYRCLLPSSDMVSDIWENKISRRPKIFCRKEAQWLWAKSEELLAGEDLQRVRRTILRRYWLGWENDKDGFKIHLRDFPMRCEDLLAIQAGRIGFSQVLFSTCYDSIFSFTVGATLLNWLVELGLDPVTCIANENARFWANGICDRKRVVFEGNE
jgi:hypothetical protein